VLLLGQRRGLIEPVSLILVGVVVAVLAGAGVALVQHLLPGQGWSVAARWTLGSLSDDAPRWLVAVVGTVTLLAIGAAAWLGPAMDCASLGEDEARSVGLPLARLRLILFAIAGGLTAGSVLLAGPIGFVGLVCPHAVRLLAGPSHRELVVGSALAGAALVVGADTLVRVADLGAGRMPIGILTALVGGPTFLWMLRSRGAAT
jgi:iron complex transport system permease protein